MITCAQCGTENPSDYSFCQECGEILSRTGSDKGEEVASHAVLPPTKEFDGLACPDCGTMNPSRYEFCRECGTPLSKGELTLEEENASPREMTPEEEKTPPGERAPMEEVVARQSVSEEELSLPASDSTHGGAFESPEQVPSLDALIPRPPEEPGKTRRLVAPEPVRGPALVHDEKDGTSRVIPLRGSLIIGRDSGDITVPEDTFLSSQHLEIGQEGEDFVLRDLDSTNGTFVSIQGSVVVKPGDLVMIDGELFRFEV